MRDLQSAYRRNLPALIGELETAASGLRVGRAAADEDIRRLAHQLKGSGGSYGFPEVSEAAALPHRIIACALTRARHRSKRFLPPFCQTI